MKIKYKLTGAKIVKTEIMRETESYVFLPNRIRPDNPIREAKQSSIGIYFDSWEEAHNYLLKRAELKVKTCKVNLKIAKEGLEIVQNMKEAD